MPSLFLSHNRSILHDHTRRFDPQSRTWSPAQNLPQNSQPISPPDAVKWLYAESNAPKLPIGVIGPREATDAQLTTAEALGARIAALSIPLMNGGRNGVMEAVSKGCAQAGGLVIGLLPDEDWQEANPYVSIPVATGIGKARNAMIAQACAVLIAVGGGYGTLSEIAYGLQFEKTVLTLEDAPEVDGAVPLTSVDDAIAHLTQAILGYSND